MRKVEAADVVWITNLSGGALLLIGALLFEPGAPAALRFDWGAGALIAWLYLLIPGSVLSVLMYYQLLRDWDASRVGTYAFISPVIAVVAGALVFGEAVGLSSATAMLLMLVAAVIALRR